MSERTPIIAGNWKANLRAASARLLCEELRASVDNLNSIEKIVCPPFVYVSAAKQALAGSSIRVGAQDVHWQDDVAATGEIGPQMLAELVDCVIIGHSERRHVFGETDEMVNRKVQAALAAGLMPIMCVGEKLSEREAGLTDAVLTIQTRAGLADVEIPDGFIIAYEPVWAIGTGKAATPEMANEAIAIIRREVAALYGLRKAQTVRILYGGSVDAGNIGELLAQPEIDGGLVGGASLKADKFAAIIREAARVAGAN